MAFDTSALKKININKNKRNTIINQNALETKI